MLLYLSFCRYMTDKAALCEKLLVFGHAVPETRLLQDSIAKRGFSVLCYDSAVPVLNASCIWEQSVRDLTQDRILLMQSMSLPGSVICTAVPVLYKSFRTRQDLSAGRDPVRFSESSGHFNVLEISKKRK